MSFKNALKNLVAHFGVVWWLLLYILIFAAVIVGLSLPFLLPITRAFSDHGVFERISEAFTALFNGGDFEGLWNGLVAAYTSVTELLRSDAHVARLVTFYSLFVIVLVFRYILGLYEIPMATVMDGQMSCNARYGFGGKFVSTLPVSLCYAFFKMLYTIIFDAVQWAIIYGLSQALGFVGSLIAMMFVILVLGGFRFALVACWAPAVASGEYGIFGGFVASCKMFFKHFGAMYSTYFVSLTLIVGIGIFLTLFTLGVGALIVLPFSACYISYLNVTEYYNINGKRYYIDGAIFTPPIVSDNKYKN